MIEACRAFPDRGGWLFPAGWSPRPQAKQATIDAFVQYMGRIGRLPPHPRGLNSIEIIWATLGARMGGCTLADRDALLAALGENWRDLSMVHL